MITSNLFDLCKLLKSEILRSVYFFHVPLILAKQDISARYKRSKIGAFWLTINTAVFIAVISFVFAFLFNNRIEVYVPMLAAAIITWNFISSILNESSSCLCDSSGMILQTNTPILSHVIRVFLRNIIIFFHNLLIIPFLYYFFNLELSINFINLIPSIFLLIFFLIGPAIFLAVICLRFRDMINIVQNILQISFYLTPIIWTVNNINNLQIKFLLMFNPFYYPVITMQSSLLSKPISFDIFLILIFINFLTLCLGLYFFGIYRKRIPFWL